jgi:hypothetical protein
MSGKLLSPVWITENFASPADMPSRSQRLSSCAWLIDVVLIRNPTMSHELPWNPSESLMASGGEEKGERQRTTTHRSGVAAHTWHLAAASAHWKWVPNTKAGGLVPVSMRLNRFALCWAEESDGGITGTLRSHEVPMACIVGAAASADGSSLQVFAYPHVAPAGGCLSWSGEVGEGLRDDHAAAHGKEWTHSPRAERLYKQLYGLEKPQESNETGERQRRVYTFHTSLLSSPPIVPSGASTSPDAQVLRTPEDAKEAVAQWVAAIRQFATCPPLLTSPLPSAHISSPPVSPPALAFASPVATESNSQRRLLVFINPVSGPGKGVEIFHGREEDTGHFSCATMLADSNALVDARVTTRAGEATDTLAAMPWPTLSAIDGIVGVGGDGILNEILQGVMKREDWAAVIERCTIGMLPAGSGNGLVCSFLAAAGLAYNLENACLLIAKNVVARMDIASTFTLGSTPIGANTGTAAPGPDTIVLVGSGKEEPIGDHHHHYPPVVSSSNPSISGMRPGTWGTRHYQFLSTSWGIVADIDIDSEVRTSLLSSLLSAGRPVSIHCLFAGDPLDGCPSI